jgi:ABC-type multidrug transport system fused ATPase/permease subunit
MLNKIFILFEIVEKKEKKKLMLFFLLFSLLMLLETIGMILIFQFINFIFGNENFLNKIIEKEYELLMGDKKFINVFVLTTIILTYVIKNLYAIYVNKIISKFIFGFQVKISNKLLNLYLSQNYLFHKNNNSSESISNVIAESNLISNKVLIPAAVLVSEMLILIGIIFFLLYIELVGTLILVTVFVFLIYFLNFILRKNIKLRSILRQLIERKKFSKLREIFSIIELIKIYNLKNFVYEDFSKTNSNYGNVLSKQYFIETLPRVFVEITTIFAITLLVLYLLFNQNKEETLSKLGIFCIASIKALPSINRIINCFQQIQSSNAVIEFFKKSFSNLSKTIKKKKIENINYTLSKKIIFKNVNIKYKNNVIFKNFNKILPFNSTILLKGKSGKGKTTFLNLLLCFLKPKKGSIKCDDVSIYANSEKWRDLISYVPQNFFLLNSSIKDNIFFGIPLNKRNNLNYEEALKCSFLNYYIKNDPKLKNSLIGENGSKLSGGQRQRVAIAQAIVRNRPILILDEATANIDSQSEIKIINRIKKIKHIKLIIVVSHRDYLKKHFDLVINLDESNNGTL